MKHFFSILAPLAVLTMVSRGAEVSPDAGIETNVIAIAKAAVPGLFYDKTLPITVSSSNGVSIVSFPRRYSRWTAVTNGPSEAARIWVNESDGTILPEEGTAAISDEEVISLCRTNDLSMATALQGDPDIRRISSLTIVTFFLPNPEHTNRLEKAYEFTIDTRTRYILGVEMFLY